MSEREEWGPSFVTVPGVMTEEQIAAFKQAWQTAMQHSQATLMPADNWLPIETAPRDGTLILAYRPQAAETGDPEIAVVRTTDYPRTSKQGVEHYTDRWCHPTHWMPLPPTPSRQKEEA